MQMLRYVRTSKVFGILLCCLFGVHISVVRSQSNQGTVRLSDGVTVRKLAEGIWLHTTYYDLANYKNVPANGLIVIDGQYALMIDLPWTDAQAGVLFDWVTREQNATIRKVVPTHFHIDCAGGLAEAHRRGAESFALKKTVELLKKEDKPVPQNWFTERMSLSCGQLCVELAFLGGGHTVDNIVAWIPSRKILFAGCMVKSLNAKNIGNIEDADLDAYPATLKKFKETFPDAKIVVPGHGRPGGLDLIDHTIKLCNNR